MRTTSSEYMFGITKDKMTRKQASRRDRIARKRGGSFVEVNVKEGSAPNLNNGRYMGWFACPASSVQENVAKEILKEVE